MNEFTMIFRIIISALLGGIIGFEREVHGRPAGIRTQMLVCLGSTVFMIISILIAVKYKEFGPVDPTRIAAGVVTGIGFLGAGAIIRAGRSIHGLTTAASIWAVSAIGMAIGYLFVNLTIIPLVFLVWVRCKNEWHSDRGQRIIR